MEKYHLDIQRRQVVHFTNDFAAKAQIGFNSSRQLCLFLLLVSQTNPFEEEETMSGLISIQDIAKFVRKNNSKRSGSIYKEVLDFVEQMMRNNFIKFESSISLKGKLLPTYISVFERLEPIEIKDSVATFYEYKFSEQMRPHIKGFLRDFVSLIIPREISSGHAIRFLIMAKAHHDHLKAYSEITKMYVPISRLKKILGIEGKYTLFTNFNRRVIQSILDGVNQSGMLKIVKHKFVKTGRKITHIEFYLQDGKFAQKKSSQKDYSPSESEVKQLTFSQHKAYQFLCEKNCKAGIVYRQILQKMPSTEYLGWEDVFIEKAWSRFEKVTKHTRTDYKAGAFIKWWQSGEFKTKLFSEIMEAVQMEKKQKSEVQLFNRNLAKRMSSEAFIKSTERL